MLADKGMSPSMTLSEKIQLLGKHSGDTQLETPSKKYQRKSYTLEYCPVEEIKVESGTSAYKSHPETNITTPPSPVSEQVLHTPQTVVGMQGVSKALSEGCHKFDYL